MSATQQQTETAPQKLTPGELEVLAPGIRQTRLIAKAVRERWPISPEMMKAIIDRQALTAINPLSSSREATSATRCVLAAVAHNLEIVKLEIENDEEAAAQQHVHVHLGDGQGGFRPPIRNVIVNRPAPAQPAPAKE